MILDLLIAAAVLAFVVGVGIKALPAASNPIERFAAKRQLSWLTLGASMAASATSADTPLLIAGAVYADGLAGNWFWWASAPGVLATLFFFARLWRRSGALTEIEIIDLRYGSGPTARWFRVFDAVLQGIVVNALVLASNCYAFVLVLNAILARWNLSNLPGISSWLMIGLGAGTAIYTVFAGFRGLAKSDAAEFAVSIVASVLLAAFAIAGLPHGIQTLQGVQTASGRPVFDLWPQDEPLAPILLLVFGWWHSAPGKGALIQRVVASRDERSAMLTVVTYAGLHYMLRPWAWYLIGAAALFYFPSLPKADAAMPDLAASLLPDGLFGLIVVAATLAFMGCVNSRLNLGASYAVNDVATVLWPSLGDRNRRLVEIGVVALLMLLPAALVVSGFSPGIRGLYQFLSMMVAGTGFVSIARWYWWRTSIASEIASLFSAAIIAALSLAVADISRPTDFAVVLALNFVVGALATVIAAWVFGPSQDAVLRRFCDRVSPGGPGWRGFGTSSRSDLRRAALQWVLANLMLVAMVNACVRFVVADWIGAVASVACGLACLVALVGFVTRPNRPEQPGSTHPAAQS